ncbi:hypothetical protein [Sphingomonas sp. 28-63-12]|uniref:hypothetical protein n=1 Tax=Sphingomonas sp. 28-63-12 TaxID=1970434 RepID=UPI0035A84E50
MAIWRTSTPLGVTAEHCYGAKMASKIEIKAATPDAFSDSDRARFRDLVIMGGEVGGAILEENIANARVLVTLWADGVMRGVVALKRPRDSYRKKVAGWTGVALPKPEVPYELGYVFIESDLQGVGWSHRLIAEALAHTDGAAIFSTVRTDNARMRATLGKAGFAAAGKPYVRGLNREIGLLTRPRALPSVDAEGR